MEMNKIIEALKKPFSKPEPNSLIMEGNYTLEGLRERFPLRTWIVNGKGEFVGVMKPQTNPETTETGS